MSPSFSIPRLAKVMSNPKTLALAIAVGVIVGMKFPSLVSTLNALELVYVDILKMLVLPFMVSTIIASISKLLQNPLASQYIRRLSLILPLSLLLVGGVSIISAHTLMPANTLNLGDARSVGTIMEGQRAISATELVVDMSAPPSKMPEISAKEAISRILPDNVFAALSDGNSLKVLIFCLLFGVALGYVPTDKSASAIASLESISKASQILMGWLNVLMPLALASMIATEVHQLDLETLVTMTTYIATQTAVCTLLMIFSTVVISHRCQQPLRRVATELRHLLVIAATTRNSVTCLPIAMKTMSQQLGFNKMGVELLLPLGITMSRYGGVAYYAVSTIFIVHTYGTPLSLTQLAGAALGCVFAGLVSAGTTGIVSIGLLSMVCIPLGLPVEGAMALFFAVDPLLDIFRTSLNAVGNCAAAAVICDLETDYSALRIKDETERVNDSETFSTPV